MLCIIKSMDSMKITKESFPERCEVCHQTDFFDPISGHCSRCNTSIAMYINSPSGAVNEGIKQPDSTSLRVFKQITAVIIAMPITIGILMLFIRTLRMPDYTNYNPNSCQSHPITVMMTTIWLISILSYPAIRLWLFIILAKKAYRLDHLKRVVSYPLAMAAVVLGFMITFFDLSLIFLTLIPTLLILISAVRTKISQSKYSIGG